MAAGRFIRWLDDATVWPWRLPRDTAAESCTVLSFWHHGNQSLNIKKDSANVLKSEARVHEYLILDSRTSVLKLFAPVHCN